jgi:hypothetical protein
MFERFLLLEPDEDGTGGSGGGGGGSDDDDAQGGVGDDAQGGDDGAQGGDGEDDGGDDADGVSKEVRDLRKEARKLRRERNEAQKELEKKQREELGEVERLKAEASERDERIVKLDERNRSLSVQLAATRVGIRPSATKAAVALLDWSDLDVEVDSEVEAALRELRSEHAYLFAGTTDDVDAGRGRKKEPPKPEDVQPGRGRLVSAYENADRTS